LPVAAARLVSLTFLALLQILRPEDEALFCGAKLFLTPSSAFIYTKQLFLGSDLRSNCLR
jgi:hypothetical protein